MPTHESELYDFGELPDNHPDWSYLHEIDPNTSLRGARVFTCRRHGSEDDFIAIFLPNENRLYLDHEDYGFVPVQDEAALASLAQYRAELFAQN
jgi:hypothetical protein